MKIKTDSNQDKVEMISLYLHSVDLNLRCILPPDPEFFSYRDGIIDSMNETKIIFRDSRELDNLIEILEKFRDECNKEMGIWKREKG